MPVSAQDVWTVIKKGFWARTGIPPFKKLSTCFSKADANSAHCVCGLLVPRYTDNPPALRSRPSPFCCVDTVRSQDYTQRLGLRTVMNFVQENGGASSRAINICCCCVTSYCYEKSYKEKSTRTKHACTYTYTTLFTTWWSTHEGLKKRRQLYEKQGFCPIEATNMSMTTDVDMLPINSPFWAHGIKMSSNVKWVWKDKGKAWFHTKLLSCQRSGGKTSGRSKGI